MATPAAGPRQGKREAQVTQGARAMKHLGLPDASFFTAGEIDFTASDGASASTVSVITVPHGKEVCRGRPDVIDGVWLGLEEIADRDDPEGPGAGRFHAAACAAMAQIEAYRQPTASEDLRVEVITRCTCSEPTWPPP